MTIFIIVAIVIVAAVLVVLLRPDIKEQIFGGEFNPGSYLKDCVEPKTRDYVKLLADQGGYSNPEGFILFNNTKVKYLCYTNEYYKTCIVQQPMIKEHFEMELSKLLIPETKKCVDALKEEYERKGYSVSSGNIDASVSVVPDKILINVQTPITVTKESSQTFKEFDLDIRSEMYDLLFIAHSIIDFEATYGDSETTLYLQYYPDLRIDKAKLSEGSKVYRVSNVVTKESFTFASRSISWPSGYLGA